jgi:predicted GH43/DUF377 family glycosyl hydrolase
MRINLRLLRAVATGSFALCVCLAHAQSWVIGPCTRATQQPVIRPNPASIFVDPVSKTPTHWEALHTFNPASIMKDGEVVILYRAEDDSGDMNIGGHVSRLGMAISRDGVNFTRMPEPVFYPARDAQADRESPGGTEDPRLVEREDGTYILTYTQWSRTHGVFDIGIASSKDLKHWTKYGPAFGSTGRYAGLKYKSAGIVTGIQNGRLVAARIQGKYWMYWGEGEIHLATSGDLIHWSPQEDGNGKPRVLLSKRPHKSDSGFPETGPPAVVTKDGVVLMYNAKNAADETRDPHVGASAYSVQEALFSAKDLSRLIGRTEEPVLSPALAWEKSGQYVSGTTFAEGLVPFHGQWWVYYGSADSFVGAATCGPVAR